jgi:hypothetical protein
MPPMSAELASSPVVRGLRVVRTKEYRRLSIWKNVVSLLLQTLPGDEDHWSVLSVHSGADVLARRRLSNDACADRIRSGFVTIVAAMSEAEFEQAEWQTVLDGIPADES